ncbi:hypothetical protein DFH08DRAFT_966765 [Mycena albidolilacea]|uniref:Uncharacterized protein n=1 Tax=Mycena albidolilacea TaxID=1033008 RepID=A0AAD6ZNI8_9AGAR|nr:hypothetical protein DFH08DRAFT_966765 [Mycena albidolilacea]
MLLTAKTFAAGAECVPIPCVRAAFGLLVIFLETVNTMQRNREDLKDLCGNAVEIVTILQGEMSAHGETALPRLIGLVENFISLVQLLQNALEKMLHKRNGLRGRLFEILQASAIAEDIVRYKIRIQELRSNLLLMTAINTNLNIVGIHKIVTASRSSPSTPGFRDVAVGDIKLLYQTAMRSETHKVKIFIARISGEPSPMTVAQYEDDMEGWKNAFHLYSSFRHPNVWQLFGVSTAPTLRALIFHDELIPLSIYRPKSDLIWACAEAMLFFAIPTPAWLLGINLGNTESKLFLGSVITLADDRTGPKLPVAYISDDSSILIKGWTMGPPSKTSPGHPLERQMRSNWQR